jgi:hypothetical protein
MRLHSGFCLLASTFSLSWLHHQIQRPLPWITYFDCGSSYSRMVGSGAGDTPAGRSICIKHCGQRWRYRRQFFAANHHAGIGI